MRSTHDGREPSRDELQRFNISQIRDLPVSIIDNNHSNEVKAAKEKQRALKRRCRKMKQRMILRGKEWEDDHKVDVNTSTESSNKAKFRRNLKELDRLYNNHSKTAWPSVAIAALERCLGEMTRAFTKSVRFYYIYIKVYVKLSLFAKREFKYLYAYLGIVYFSYVSVSTRSKCISKSQWI